MSNGPEWSARSLWELRLQVENWGGRARGDGQGQREEGRRGGSTGTGAQTHLQDEDEVVRRLVASVQVMTGVVLVVLVELELLDDVWVLEQPQQDLL